MSNDDRLATGIGPAAVTALPQAAAEDDTDAASLWCARLAQFGMIGAAQDHFRPAAEGGDLAAVKCLVWLAWEAGQDGDAVTWLRRAARADDPWAMFELGRSLPDEAEQWYRRAAEKGDGLAMNNLGSLLSRAGRREEAMDWYRRAAEAGVELAMNNLAIQHVLQGDTENAGQWFRRAADAGSVDGMANLGRLKLETDDLQEAETWLTRAAERGHAGAAELLADLLTRTGEPDR
ncbi:tetratricopeptide repeat protein [Actinomadura livida]|uniref:TPR repeat protein n=1 Tax=Actinomadura livida TaxID=79909 RepID=A0A7W7IFY8_9ACTN|nr:MULTISPECIES: tetratricopeptide repeat protein [Actinomadura]MBB4776396.1 TPR repeat protein [Actinomadura catellatispora]GGT92093.1 hypothetical protein GCM10010208_13590 [Actinomadura livida]